MSDLPALLLALLAGEPLTYRDRLTLARLALRGAATPSDGHDAERPSVPGQPPVVRDRVVVPAAVRPRVAPADAGARRVDRALPGREVEQRARRAAE